MLPVWGCTLQSASWQFGYMSALSELSKPKLTCQADKCDNHQAHRACTSPLHCLLFSAGVVASFVLLERAA